MEECKARALAYLRKMPRGYLTNASSVATAIWPDTNFTAQGGGAAASRILKILQKEKLVEWVSRREEWGYTAIGGRS
jgi:predicted NodU family carbamoyl transferase